MGGMLAAAMRTPILAILLVLEMTNSFSNIYAIGIVTIVAYLVAELLKEPPVYDSLITSHDRSKQPRERANLLPNQGACSGILCGYTITRPQLARRNLNR